MQQSPCLTAAELVVCLHGCCTGPLLVTGEQQHEPQKKKMMSSNSKSTTSARRCRQGFASITASTFFPNTHFTNHENLPSLLESFLQFTKAYPQYSDTSRVDQIRAQEYYHLSLSKHVCLDYIGIGLFSYLQVESHSHHDQYYPPPVLPDTSSSSSPPTLISDPPFFSLTYKSVNLKSELLHGGRQGSHLESVIRKKIMHFLNISQNDYSMVFTANKSSAFKLLAESYPFQHSRKLLTVYDYESEALQTMVKTSEKRGAKIMSAEFKWPRLRVHTIKLRKMIVRKKKKKHHRGLFVIPLQSRMTGASYSYQWMSIAQENGWHVLLDGCALGPKDMDSFGLSLFRPDFLVCSFYKVIGENPTGFGCLFVKRSTVPILQEASTGSTTGIVSIVPPGKQLISESMEEYSSTETEQEQTSTPEAERDHEIDRKSSAETVGDSETMTSNNAIVPYYKLPENEGADMQFRCLDHVDSLGLMLISSRGRYLINWLVSAIVKLEHPNRLDNFPLVRIYGPKVKFDRGPALSFNIYDWKGEKVDPVLVQKLADRNHISLSTGFLQNIWFSDEHEQEKSKTMETIRKSEEMEKATRKKSRKADQGIQMVTAALSFLASFEDVHRLWAFIAQFLDADFVEKERWRYTALDQKTVEV